MKSLVELYVGGTSDGLRKEADDQNRIAASVMWADTGTIYHNAGIQSESDTQIVYVFRYGGEARTAAERNEWFRGDR